MQACSISPFLSNCGEHVLSRRDHGLHLPDHWSNIFNSLTIKPYSYTYFIFLYERQNAFLMSVLAEYVRLLVSNAGGACTVLADMEIDPYEGTAEQNLWHVSYTSPLLPLP